MQRTAEDVAGFIAGSDDAEALTQLDALVRSSLPGVTATLWRGVFWGGTEQAIIGYGDLVQQRPDGRAVDWFLVGLARQKRHFSLYVSVVEGDRYLPQVYAERLGRVKVGASAVTFRSVADLDLEAVVEMLSRVAPHLRQG